MGRTKRVQVPLTDRRYGALERYAKMQGGTLAVESSIIFSTLIDEMIADGRIPPEDAESDRPDSDDMEQIRQFLLLMMGKRKRNGIAISEIADLLDIDQEALADLYQKTLDTMEEATCSN